MKCPKCGTNHRYRDGMKCNCHYQFALDPKSDQMTDGKLLALVRGASSNGTYYFTPHQLYTTYCSRHRDVGRLPVIAMVGVVATVAVLMVPPEIKLVCVSILLFALVAIVIAAFVPSSVPPRSTLEKAVQKYEGIKGPISKLVRSHRLADPPPEWDEPDIYDYGVERVLVVQRDILVDLLVLNGFHKAQRTLIISGGGYPTYLTPMAVQVLEQNSEMPVFFLHDATREGLAWFEQISKSKKLPWQDHAKVDLGIYPDDIRRIKKLRKLRPELSNYGLEIDVLPYAMLVVGLEVAIEERQSLGYLLALRDAEKEHAPSSFG